MKANPCDGAIYYAQHPVVQTNWKWARAQAAKIGWRKKKRRVSKIRRAFRKGDAHAVRSLMTAKTKIKKNGVKRS